MRDGVDFVKRYMPINKRRLFTMDQTEVIQAVTEEQISKLNEMLSLNQELDSNLYQNIFEEMAKTRVFPPKNIVQPKSE